MIKRASQLKERLWEWYYTAEGGPFDSVSSRNMLILAALAFVSQC